MAPTKIRIAVTAAAVAFSGSAHGAVFNITPANNIQATINMASDGDTIVFAAGTYNQVANLGAKQLTLEGAGIGQTIVSAAFLNDSVLRGSGIGSNMGGLVIRDMTIADGVTPTNATGVGYPVDGAGLVLANSTVRVERVRFESNQANDDGGGMYTDASSVTIVDCEFEGNTAKGSGGGCLVNFGTVSISGTTFTTNEALDTNADGDAGWGGGLFLISQSAAFSVTGCTFDGNAGTRGGAMYLANTSGLFSFCTFENNDASEGFGGVCYAQTGGSITVEDSVLRRNSAGSQGGAIYSNNPAWIFRRCMMVGNEATNEGGAVFLVNNGNSTYDRCGFYGNVAGGHGGAVWSNRPTVIGNSLFAGNDSAGGTIDLIQGPSSVTHCTFYGNTATANPIALGGASGTITMRNCLATENLPVNDTVGGTGWSIQYSNIERSDPMALVPGTGNINATPLLGSPPSPGADMMWGTLHDDFGDLRLQAGSPGIDAGDSQSVLSILQDYAGDSRNLDDPAAINSGVSAWALCVDMGAYEFQPPAAPPACPGNANGDMVVDFDDITEVLANWQSICP